MYGHASEDRCSVLLQRADTCQWLRFEQGHRIACGNQHADRGTRC
jgi:hypothetical protein